MYIAAGKNTRLVPPTTIHLHHFSSPSESVTANRTMLPTAAYKDVTTRRGYRYHYYYAPSQGSKPTLLFVHGFPSTSQDWHRLIPHLERDGYGIIAPDVLGYGGTDKPIDPVTYKGTAIARDLIDIVDAEGVEKVVAVGHDW